MYLFFPYPALQQCNTDVITHTRTHRHLRYSTQTHHFDSWVYDRSVIVLAVIDEKYFIKTVAVEMTLFFLSPTPPPFHCRDSQRAAR